MADKRQKDKPQPVKKSSGRSPSDLNYVAQNRAAMNAKRKQRKHAKAVAAAEQKTVAHGAARAKRRPAIIAARNIAKENARRAAAGTPRKTA